MNEILKFIEDLFLSNGIVIAVGCFVVGQIIKSALDMIPNKYIPLICGILGAVAGATIPGIFPDTHVVIAAINGLALGWAATGGVETIKGLKEGKHYESGN